MHKAMTHINQPTGSYCRSTLFTSGLTSGSTKHQTGLYANTYNKKDIQSLNTSNSLNSQQQLRLPYFPKDTFCTRSKHHAKQQYSFQDPTPFYVFQVGWVRARRPIGSSYISPRLWYGFSHTCCLNVADLAA